MTVRLPVFMPSLIDVLSIADIGAYTYGLGHLMKPHRMRMTHELATAYGMLEKMHVLVSKPQQLFPFF